MGDHSKVVIKEETVLEFLGPPFHTKDEDNDYDEVGVATALAWTPVGGEVLYIESTNMPGKGLTLTGQLGEVMKESAQAAIGYIRSRSSKYGIDANFFDHHEIHLHMPAGAIPKDGPSAGIAMAVAIISFSHLLADQQECSHDGRNYFDRKSACYWGDSRKNR